MAPKKQPARLARDIAKARINSEPNLSPRTITEINQVAGVTDDHFGNVDGHGADLEAASMTKDNLTSLVIAYGHRLVEFSKAPKKELEQCVEARKSGQQSAYDIVQDAQLDHEFKNQTINALDNANYLPTIVLSACRGARPAESPCKVCSKEAHRRFTPCLIFTDDQGTKHQSGACLACTYTNHSTGCSFHPDFLKNEEKKKQKKEEKKKSKTASQSIDEEGDSIMADASDADNDDIRKDQSAGGKKKGNDAAANNDLTSDQITASQEAMIAPKIMITDKTRANLSDPSMGEPPQEKEWLLFTTDRMPFVEEGKDPETMLEAELRIKLFVGAGLSPDETVDQLAKTMVKVVIPQLPRVLGNLTAHLGPGHTLYAFNRSGGESKGEQVEQADQIE